MVETEQFLSFDAWGNRRLSDLEGRTINFQAVQPDAAAHVERVIFPLRLDAMGSAQVLVRTDKCLSSEAPDTDLEASSAHIANGHLRAELDGSGIRRLISGGRDLLGEGGVELHLRRDLTDTWTFHTDRFVDPVETVLQTEGWIVEETGPLRARVRSEGWLGRSAVRWTLTLHRDEPRIHIRVEVNFSERLNLLQMPVHLAAPPTRRTDGLAGRSTWPPGNPSVRRVGGDAYSLSL